MYRFFSALGGDALVEILKQSNDATVIYSGPDLKIQLINDAMLSIWGKDQSVHGKTFEEALPEMQGQPFTELLKNVWTTGKKFQAIDTPATLEINGNMVTSYFDFIYKPIFNSEGQVYCIVHTAVDVTERVRAWKMVREKEEREQQINEEYMAKNEELNEKNDQIVKLYETLSLTEDRIRQLVNTTPVGLSLIKSREMLVETANTNMLNIWGFSEKMVIGKSLLDIFPSFDKQVFAQQINLVYSTKKIISLDEIIFVSPKNPDDIKYLDINFHPLFDLKNHIDAIMVTAVDVTDKVIDRKNLEEAERKLQESYEELTALNEELQSQNEEIAALNEEYLATNDQLDQTNEFLSVLNNELKRENTDLNDENYEFREDKSTLDNSIKNLSLKNTQLSELNESITGLNRKLTEGEAILKNSEGRLQSILETMAEGVCVVDQDGKVSYANPMAQQILNLSEAQIKERMYNDSKWINLRLDGSPLPIEEHPMHMMLRTGKPVLNFEIALQPPGRDIFYISVNAAPLFDHHGNLIGGIGTFTDVTSRIMIMQGKDDFISIASHELKTPVTSLKATLQLLQRSHERLPVETRTKLLDQSTISLEKLSSLINDLLNTSRIEQGQMKINKQNFTLSELFDECCAGIIANSRKKIVFDGDVSQLVDADNQQIGQVMINFINNAIKYAPESESITIKIANIDQIEIKISVVDQGPGIPSEKLEHLFKRYYRTNYQGQRFTGLGLGLYISADIIKNHGGRIGVESQCGKGSEFWFTLPV